MSDQDSIPPSFGYAGLAIMLQRSIGSLQADMCRKPHTLPPACRIPGTKQPIWLRADVLAWLAKFRAEPVAKEKREVGRPRKTPSAAPQQGGGQ